MPIIKSTSITLKTIVMLVFLCAISNMLWAYGSRDPILETQSKAVPVTEESLKDEAKTGAPAPTFKLVHDTGIFFIKTPVENLEEESVKKWEWTTVEPDSTEAPGEKSESDEDFDISNY